MNQRCSCGLNHIGLKCTKSYNCMNCGKDISNSQKGLQNEMEVIK